MGNWSDMGSKREFGHPDVLYFKANEQHAVRLLDDELPLSVFYHSCRDEAGNFVKVHCVGSRQGCRFCEQNNKEEYAKAANADRPYPFRSEFVKAVWVYELNAMRLLIGKQVWDKCIKPLGVSYGTLANRDLQVIRQDTNGQVSYTVVPKDPAPFAFAAQAAAQPKPDIAKYVAWLDANAVQVIAAKMAGSQPVTASTAGFTTVPAPAPVAPIAPAGNDQDKKNLQAEFARVMAKKFEPRLVEGLIAKHGQGRSTDLMTVAELTALVADYKAQAQVE